MGVGVGVVWVWVCTNSVITCILLPQQTLHTAYMYMYITDLFMYITEFELPCPSGETCTLPCINFKDWACPAGLLWW